MKKYSVLILAGFLGMASLTCAAEGEAPEVKVEAEAKAETKESAEKELTEIELTEAEAIGEESETSLSLKLKNQTGMDIVKMELSYDGETFGENLLGKDVVFAALESRDWFVEKPEKEEAKIDLRLTFGEELTLTLHDLPFGKTQEAALEYSGKYAYLTYLDEKGEEVSTLKAEKKLAKKAKKAKEEASQEETSQESTAAVQESAPVTYDYTEPVYDYSTEPVYDYDQSNTYDYGTEGGYDSGWGNESSDDSDSSDDDPNEWTYTYDDGGDGGDNCLDDGITLN